jgi:hypothetical protein
MKTYIHCVVTRYDGSTFIEMLTMDKFNKIAELLHLHKQLVCEHIDIDKETYYQMFPEMAAKDNNRKSYFLGEYWD